VPIRTSEAMTRGFIKKETPPYGGVS